MAREGLEFGVLARTLAVGGQVLSLRGLAGEYHEVFLPLMGQHQAHNAASRWPRSRRSSAAGTRSAGRSTSTWCRPRSPG